MQLVTFAEPFTINYGKSTGTVHLQFEAGRDYVMARQQVDRLLQQPGIRERTFKISRIESRIQNFNVNARKAGPQRLLLYNGSGGYGDQIMTWPFAWALTRAGFEVHVLSDPGNSCCWFNFPWVRSIQTLPMQYETFMMYPYHVMFEAVVNTDEHQDQDHPLDVMLNKVGIDPATVDPKMKVIAPNFTFLEANSTSIFQSSKIGMWQLASATQTRCLPANDSAFMLSQVADAFPDIHWLALYDEFVPADYKNAVTCQKCGGKGRNQLADIVTTGTDTVPFPRPEAKNEICLKCKGSGTLRTNIQLYCAEELRELWALTGKAAVVVAPDSMMVHAAGCVATPCVGLWGLTNPENRVKYYQHHVAVYKRDVCAFSPCHTYGGEFPRYCPPRNKRNVCECIAAVSSGDIVQAVKKAIASKAAPVPA